MDIKNIKKANELLNKIIKLDAEMKKWERVTKGKEFFLYVTSSDKVKSNDIIVSEKELDPLGTGFMKFPAFDSFVKLQVNQMKADKKDLEDQLTRL